MSDRKSPPRRVCRVVIRGGDELADAPTVEVVSWLHSAANKKILTFPHGPIRSVHPIDPISSRTLSVPRLILP